MIVVSPIGREFDSDAAQRPDFVTNDDSSFRENEGLDLDLDLDDVENFRHSTPRDGMPDRMAFPYCAPGGG